MLLNTSNHLQIVMSSCMTKRRLRHLLVAQPCKMRTFHYTTVCSVSSLHSQGNTQTDLPTTLSASVFDSAATQKQLHHHHHPHAAAASAASAWSTAPTSQQQLQSNNHSEGLLQLPSANKSSLPAQQSQHQQQRQQQEGMFARLSAGRAWYIHAAFGSLFIYLGVMAVAATNPDWYLDIGAFGLMWGLLWVACGRLQPSPRTVVLLNLLPLMHLSGALEMYHWELGNLSWDIVVHISNGFIGTLLFAAALSDWTAHQDAAVAAAVTAAAAAAGAADKLSSTGSIDALTAASSAASSRTSSPSVSVQVPGVVGNLSNNKNNANNNNMPNSRWRPPVLRLLQLTGLLLLSTALIEVVEAAAGQAAGQLGEGIFLRGPGDLCTASVPCSEEVDTAKDMFDNCTGMTLALLALATRRGGGEASNSSSSSRAASNPDTDDGTATANSSSSIGSFGNNSGYLAAADRDTHVR